MTIRKAHTTPMVLVIFTENVERSGVIHLNNLFLHKGFLKGETL